MKRIFVYAVSGLLLAGTGFGAVSGAGEAAPAAEDYDYSAPQTQYDGRGTDAEAREFENEMERERAASDPDEIARRSYIPRFMQGSTGSVIGTVTLVGDNVMRMSEAGTRIEYEVMINDAQEKALTTGFNISAELSNGRLVSFVEEGVPPDVEKIVYSAEGLPTDNILEKQKAF